MSSFFYNTDISSEMTMKMILESIMHFEYDEITCIYLKNDSYSIMAGKKRDTRPCANGSLFKGAAKLTLTLLPSKRETSFTISWHLVAWWKVEEQQTLFYPRLHMEDGFGSNRLKQIRFMYLDQRTGMVLLTRADIEDVVKKKNASRNCLELALEDAEKANQAKSEFLQNQSWFANADECNSRTFQPWIRNGKHGRRNRLSKKLTILDTYLLGLINDTLDVSRIEQNGLTLKTADYLFARLIESNRGAYTRVLARQERDRLYCRYRGNWGLLYPYGRMRIHQIFKSPFQCGEVYASKGQSWD